MGYPIGHKGWEVYDLETHNFFVTRDIVFQEHIFPFAKIKKKYREDTSKSLETNKALGKTIFIDKDKPEKGGVRKPITHTTMQCNRPLQIMVMAVFKGLLIY